MRLALWLVPLLAAAPAAAQHTGPAAQHTGSAAQPAAAAEHRLPRYLYVARERPDTIAAAKETSLTTINEPLRLDADETLHDENPIRADFYTIDTTRLAKQPIPHAERPGVYTPNGEIPAEAIVSFATQSQRWLPDGHLWKNWNVSFNSKYINQYQPGNFPRVWFNYAQGRVTIPPEQRGLVGPKLYVTADHVQVAPLATPRDALSVVLHSSGTGFSKRLENGRSVSVSPRELARDIKAEIARLGLPRDIRINLIACSAGALGERSPAQQLADEMVDADNPAGNVVVAMTGIAATVGWVTDHPDSTRDAVSQPMMVSEQHVSAGTYGSPQQNGRYRTFIGRNAVRPAGSRGLNVSPGTLAHVANEETPVVRATAAMRAAAPPRLGPGRTRDTARDTRRIDTARRAQAALRVSSRLDGRR